MTAFPVQYPPVSPLEKFDLLRVAHAGRERLRPIGLDLLFSVRA